MHDTEIDIETRNGNTVGRSTPVDISTPEGKAVVRAQAALSAAESAERTAFQKWATKSAPEAAEAVRTYDQLQGIIDANPIVLEALFPEFFATCRT